MNIPNAEAMAEDIYQAIKGWNATTDRGKQTHEHRIGISDIGNCREYVRWMTIEQEFTNEPELHQAFIGSWLGEGIEQAVSGMFPKAKTKLEVTVELPSGLKLTGHPDLVLPRGVLDVKTVDGLTGVRKHGPSEQQQFQRHLYAAALVQAGELPEDCFVGNVWVDRSGRDPKPFVNLESYDPTWLKRADEWLSDVHYAVTNKERAFQDKPIEWCEVCCPFFSVCRGEDARKDREQGGMITDAFAVDYVDTLIQAREQKKEAEKTLEDCRRALAGVSGSTGTHMVRWVYVGPSQVPGYERAAYEKLDVRRIPNPKSRS